MKQITIPTSHITRLFKEQNKENGREKKQQTKYKKKLREMIQHIIVFHDANIKVALKKKGIDPKEFAAEWKDKLQNKEINEAYALLSRDDDQDDLLWDNLCYIVSSKDWEKEQKSLDLKHKETFIERSERLLLVMLEHVAAEKDIRQKVFSMVKKRIAIQNGIQQERQQIKYLKKHFEATLDDDYRVIDILTPQQFVRCEIGNGISYTVKPDGILHVKKKVNVSLDESHDQIAREGDGQEIDKYFLIEIKNRRESMNDNIKLFEQLQIQAYMHYYRNSREDAVPYISGCYFVQFLQISAQHPLQMQTEYLRCDNNIYGVFIDACQKFKQDYEEKYEAALDKMI